MSEFVDFEELRDIIKGITGIKYEETFFSIEKMSIGQKMVYTILPTGRIVLRVYKDNMRKIHSKKTVDVPQDTVLDYYSKIINCMKTAINVSEYVDDCGATLTIDYWGGQIILPRGLESANDSISSISCEFLSSVGIYFGK